MELYRCGRLWRRRRQTQPENLLDRWWGRRMRRRLSWACKPERGPPARKAGAVVARILRAPEPRLQWRSPECRRRPGRWADWRRERDRPARVAVCDRWAFPLGWL